MAEFETVKEQLKKRFHEKGAWGLSTSINLKNCNPKIIRDAGKIKKYVKELCKLIGMKTYGQTVVIDFGHDARVAGFSMTQLIETSLISGHFANQSNAVQISDGASRVRVMVIPTDEQQVIAVGVAGLLINATHVP